MTSASGFPVRLERRGAVAWIRLASPQTRNALSSALLQGLHAALDEVEAEASLRAVVLTGEGAAFCAGADLSAQGGMEAEGPAARHPLGLLLERMRALPLPVIAAVNGAAFGGGLGLVAAADLAIGAEDAKFSFSEVRLGVAPAIIAVVVVPVIGERAARRFFLSGERFDAEQARALGLLQRVVPVAELERAVEAQLAALLRGGPRALAAVKRLLHDLPALGEAEAWTYTERLSRELFASEEAAEGMAAFREKRPPAWVGEAGE